jgi:acyl dehydratase
MTAWSVGDDLPPLDAGEITRELITEYSRVSKDPNPMHTDEVLAKEMGYSSVYAQGMLGMALLTRHLGAVAGVGNLKRIKVRFKTMTWPGERITCRGSVTAVEKHGDKQRVTCDIRTENQDGVPKVIGSATFEA